MKTLGLSAKTLVLVFALGMFLGTSGISSAGREYHTSTASQVKVPHKYSHSGKLDGKLFLVTLTQPGQAPLKDSLIFRSGTFRSTACHTYGFDSGKYGTKESGQALTFTSKTQSTKEGIMLWKGSLRGNQVQGTVEWTKKNQAKPVEMTFSGSVAEPQAKTEASPK